MEQTPPERRRIRLFPDHGRYYPLWENSAPTWDVGYATSPEDYGLSPRLAAALADWQAFWECHVDPFKGWDSAGNRQQWEHDGHRLARDLQTEVHAFADVHPEF
ncbi:hypothetical protein GCM10011575_25680 [Microlunatus endophyticus]|uniref:Uncharacterized protein n=1 Tax=Microlunatus endophyticus TaxID=1716077 RepID=A0A917SBB0_9ACTN|nr:hypothetical protein [Microlunatus endophyticus]GGL66070.1 hypothetical protein GCM10011575_25680 [Microlunatus endophyticus]